MQAVDCFILRVLEDSLSVPGERRGHAIAGCDLLRVNVVAETNETKLIATDMK